MLGLGYNLQHSSDYVNQYWRNLLNPSICIRYNCLGGISWTNRRKGMRVWKDALEKDVIECYWTSFYFNPLTSNDDYSGRTTLLNVAFYVFIQQTEYFKHGIYSPFFPLQNAVCFINLTYLVSVLFTFYIQGVLKLKKKTIPAPKG